MRKLITLFIFLGILFFNVCDFGYCYKKHIIGDYYLVATDIIEEASIGTIYKGNDHTGISYIIYQGVYSVGNDEQFIIVKQHPFDIRPELDKNSINYYIIPLINKISKLEGNNLFGPMTKEEFIQKRNELGIDKNLDFTIVIEELE
jgi:hypothetical protein